VTTATKQSHEEWGSMWISVSSSDAQSGRRRVEESIRDGLSTTKDRDISLPANITDYTMSFNIHTRVIVRRSHSPLWVLCHTANGDNPSIANVASTKRQQEKRSEMRITLSTWIVAFLVRAAENETRHSAPWRLETKKFNTVYNLSSTTRSESILIFGCENAYHANGFREQK
jgi:hypothetical protein